MKHRECETCGKRVKYTPGRGRPPKYCIKHRKKTAASSARQTKRQRSKRAAAKRAASGDDLYLATKIAYVRQFWPNLDRAAAYVGVPKARRAALCKLAEDVDVSPGASLARLRVGAAMIAEQAIFMSDQISPRDAAHVAKALATAYKDFSQLERPQYSEVTVTFAPSPDD